MSTENPGARARFEERVRALEALGHRGSATELEGRGAELLARELEGVGLPARIEELLGCDSLGARLLVHVLVAGLGLAVVTVAPLATVLLGAFALASLVLESETRGFLLSRFVRRRPSRNVVARVAPPGGSDPRHTLILCAHIDTQRTGVMWGGRLGVPLAPLLQRLPGPVRSPMFAVVAAMVCQVALGAAAVLASAAGPWGWIGAGLGVVYVVAAFLLADWARGAFVPGAADNASGAAAVVELAGRWVESPVDGVELRVVLCGCEETGDLGAAAWIDAHRGELDPRGCTFLNVDTLGYGSPRVIGTEHSLAAIPHRYPAALLRLASDVAARRGLSGAGPWVLPTFSDGLAFLARGYEGLSVLTFEDGVQMPTMHLMTDTSEHMDFDVGAAAMELAWDLLVALAEARVGSQRSVTPAAS